MKQRKRIKRHNLKFSRLYNAPLCSIMDLICDIDLKDRTISVIFDKDKYRRL